MSRTLSHSLLLGFLLALPGAGHSAVVYANVGKISEVWTWAATGTPVEGDTVIRIETGIAQCPSGVFLDAGEGSEKAYSAVLSAHSAQRSVKIQVYDDVLWNGSSTPYCKLRAIFVK